MSEPDRDADMMTVDCPRCLTSLRIRGESMRVMCYACGVAFPTASLRVDTSL